MTTHKNALLTDAECEAALAKLSGWTLVNDRIHKRFEFADFPSAIAFMVRAAFAAERFNHHPNWSNVYNRVDVEISSHELGGVSRLCVELAQALDRLE